MLTWWYPYRLEFQSQEAALFMQLLLPLLSQLRFCAFAVRLLCGGVASCKQQGLFSRDARRDAVVHPRESRQGGVGDLEPPRTFAIFYAVDDTRNS